VFRVSAKVTLQEEHTTVAVMRHVCAFVYEPYCIADCDMWSSTLQMENILASHGNSGYANAQRCHIISTMPASYIFSFALILLRVLYQNFVCILCFYNMVYA